MVEKSNHLVLSPDVLEKVREMYRIAGTEEEFGKHPNELLGYFFDEVLHKARRIHAQGHTSDILEKSCTSFALERLREPPEEKARKMEEARKSNMEIDGEMYVEEGTL